jgi:sec-independent protein translocase protein TatB
MGGGMIGLTFDKIILIAVIGAFLIGPQRLPALAASLGRLVRYLRQLADGAKRRVREEMGDDFDAVDWKQLDPRQYDPRRIIRGAFVDDLTSDERSVVESEAQPDALPAKHTNESVD